MEIQCPYSLKHDQCPIGFQCPYSLKHDQCPMGFQCPYSLKHDQCSMGFQCPTLYSLKHDQCPVGFQCPTAWLALDAMYCRMSYPSCVLQPGQPPFLDLEDLIESALQLNLRKSPNFKLTLRSIILRGDSEKYEFLCQTKPKRKYFNPLVSGSGRFEGTVAVSCEHQTKTIIITVK